MKTELEVVPQFTKPGNKIQVQQFKIVNVHLHRVLLTSSRTMNAMLEMDAANSNAGMAAAEARSILSDWNRVKTEWARALEYRGLAPTGGYEHTNNVLLITPNQILSISNVRTQSALQAIRGFCERVLSSDSASQEFDIQRTDEVAIAQHITYVDTVLADYIGTVSDTEFQRGLEIPAHTHLGGVTPPESLGEAVTSEPGPNIHDGVPVPDVADVPSTVPPQQ